MQLNYVKFNNLVIMFQQKFVFLFLLLLCNSINVFSQHFFEDKRNTSIYMFLDELANEKIISLNSATKPYSKRYILNKLKIASNKKINNLRIQKELGFFLKKYKIYERNIENDNIKYDFNNLSIYYKNSESFFLIKPIWGITRQVYSNQSYQYLFGGISAEYTFKKNWSAYAKLIDNTMTIPNALPDFLTDEYSGNYKSLATNDYSEMNGGIIYSNGHTSFSIIKENIEWGDNYYGSNILSGRTPSFPMIKFYRKINKFLEINYLHAWLFSEDIDSLSSYYSSSGNYRAIYREKFLASNLITLNISDFSKFSFGNSIVYGDVNGVQLPYLIPFFFYKSIDHSLNHNIENQNSQMFFNLSIREIKHLHLYSSIFIDEFKKDRVFNDSLNNFISYKIGIKLSNWPLQNISNIIEYNHTNPMTYKHTVNGTTYESNQVNLGHYLRDNSKVINYNFLYKFNNRIYFSYDFFYAMHGDEKEYNNYNNYNPVSIPIISNKTWDNTTNIFTLKGRVKNNVTICLKYQISNIQGYDSDEFNGEYYLNLFTPVYLHGKTKTITLDFNLGF